VGTDTKLAGLTKTGIQPEILKKITRDDFSGGKT
jgi:hypothetical protein